MKETKVLIVSDSHGRNNYVYDVLDEHSDADMLIHLGDIEDGYEEICKYAQCKVVLIRGNCDSPFSPPAPTEVISIAGHKIFATHGHMFDVYSDTDTLFEVSSSLECDICLFGHLHVPSYEKVEGIEIFNPGSLAYPRQQGRKRTYGVLTIDIKGNTDFELLNL